MSMNGDDEGDDIDDLVREMRNTNRNIQNLSDQLDRLINSIIRGAREREEGEDSVDKADLWDVGTVSPGTATSVDEYIKLRSQTAQSSELTVPMIDVSNNSVFMADVFSSWADHLQRIFQGLSNDNWEKFVQEISIRNGVERRLVEILDPGTLMFGINDVDGNVNVFSSSTHMNFIRYDGNFWFLPTPLYSGNINQDINDGPWDILGIRGPVGEEDVEIIGGELQPVDINRDLASAIDRRRDLTLPHEFTGLL